ncbi:hypothetical protein ACFQX6_37785 [Streptosporangium lutulentum]
MSVVIATRDRIALLRRAVAAALDQDYPGTIEVVVVFDRSEPEDLGIEERPGRRLRTTRNVNTPAWPEPATPASRSPPVNMWHSATTTTSGSPGRSPPRSS